ncbi:hypothetical protein C8R43DRAFT_1131324 [Mycena crocata]|nr:hypothetical protein C8R43DRAFT_1131324 [Mycena crocata]
MKFNSSLLAILIAMAVPSIVSNIEVSASPIDKSGYIDARHSMVVDRRRTRAEKRQLPFLMDYVVTDEDEEPEE